MINKKTGSVMTIIEVHKSNCTERNVILDFDINQLRKRVGNFITKQRKKIKPDGNLVGWKTSIGDFVIYKEIEYGNWDLWKCKYKQTKTMLEFVPKKGEIIHKTLSVKKTINPDYEGLDECTICGTKTLLDYSVVRQGEKINCCKKCRDFDKILNKLDKKIPLSKSEMASLVNTK